MIDKRTLFEVHRLAHEGLSIRKIARAVGLHRETVSKSLHDPHPKRAPITRSSKLDPLRRDGPSVGNRPYGLRWGHAAAPGRSGL
jgi:Helix-turn-helix domain